MPCDHLVGVCCGQTHRVMVIHCVSYDMASTTLECLCKHMENVRPYT